jgi:hypothetical protein
MSMKFESDYNLDMFNPRLTKSKMNDSRSNHKIETKDTKPLQISKLNLDHTKMQDDQLAFRNLSISQRSNESELTSPILNLKQMKALASRDSMPLKELTMKSSGFDTRELTVTI